MSNENPLHSGATPAYADAMLKYLGNREPMEVFAATPGDVRKAVAGLSTKQVQTPEAPGKWSVAGVIQHLVDVEITLGLRYRRVLAQPGKSIPAIDQDALAAATDYNHADVPGGLDDFEAIRRANLRFLRKLTSAQMESWGIHEERGRETLAHMVRLYAAHDCYHLYQIERIKKAIGAA